MERQKLEKKPDPGPITATNNCLYCKKYAKCERSKKSWNYICHRFSAIEDRLNTNLTIIDIKPKNKQEPETEESSFRRDFEDAIAKENSSPLPPDLKIDDRDIPQAKNVYEFLTDKRFLNVTPFAKQIEDSIHCAADWCPRCSNPDYVNDIPKRAKYRHILEEVQLLENGKCPKCKARKSELYASGELKVPVAAAILCGQRSGKSAWNAMFLSNSIHRFLKLQNASKVYGLLPNQMLMGKLTALSLERAIKLVYNPIYEYLYTAPWFVEYHQMLDHYAARYGEQLYNLKPTFANYRCRNIHIQPSVPDKRKLRGDTSFICSADEIGWLFSNTTRKSSSGNGLDDDSMTLSAREIYASMNNSMKTLRNRYYKMLRRGYDALPPPMFPVISSPSSKKDYITELYNQSITDPYLYGAHRSTWEHNPNLRRSDFNQEFQNNPVKAMRDFGAVPPNSSNPYIGDIEQLKGIINKDLSNKVIFSPRVIEAANGKTTISGKVKFPVKDSNKRIMALDAGAVKNSFALVAGYLDEDSNRPVFDVFVEIQPRPDCPINHNAVFEDVIGPIIEHMNIKFLVSDRWQNIKLLQDAEAEFDIESEAYSVKYTDFEAVRQDVYENYLTIPRQEIKAKDIEQIAEDNYPQCFDKAPVAHLLYQFITVNDMGKEVTKGDATTDDLLRALVLAYSFICDEKYADYCQGKTTMGARENPFIAVFGSRGGGSGNVGGSSNVVTGSDGNVLAVMGSISKG